MNSFKCQECDTTVYRLSLSDRINICHTCGTTYENKNVNILGDEVSVELEITGYTCMEFGSYSEKCHNKTLAPFMYCEYHSSDEYINKVEQNVDAIKKNLQRAADKLDRVRESRRNWMISKLGGISE